MIRIFVDADGCPVKAEVFRVAGRHGIKVFVVANSHIKIPQDDLFELVHVEGKFDAADDWIAGEAGGRDIVVTADIPLAARCLEKGSRVLDPKGRVFTEETIGEALASRELMAYLREMGNMTGGPPPFENKDRSRFLQRLEELIQALLKQGRAAGA